jgi:hypothetical protein
MVGRSVLSRLLIPDWLMLASFLPYLSLAAVWKLCQGDCECRCKAIERETIGVGHDDHLEHLPACQSRSFVPPPRSYDPTSSMADLTVVNTWRQLI